MCLWLKPWRVSAVCTAFTQLYSVRLVQPPVLTVISATTGLVLTVKSDVYRDTVMPSTAEKKKKKMLGLGGGWGCSDFTVRCKGD